MSTITNLPVFSGSGGYGGISEEALNAALTTALVDVAKTSDIDGLADKNTLDAVKDTVDAVSTNVANVNNRLTDARATAIDTINTNAARLTAARATAIDTITDSTNGLTAIKTAVDTVATNASNAATNASNAATSAANAATYASNVNTRLTDTRAGYIDAINTNASNLNSRLTSTRAGYLDYLANSTYGLSAIKTAVDTVDGIVDTINTNTARLTSTRAGYIDLLKNLTATRAGYLDYLANSTYGLSAIKTAIGNIGGLSACVKSVQRGTVTFGSTNAREPVSKTVTINSVTPSKSLVFITWYTGTSGHDYGSVRAVLTNATTVTLVRGDDYPSDGGYYNVYAAWQVVEFY